MYQIKSLVYLAEQDYLDLKHFVFHKNLCMMALQKIYIDLNKEDKSLKKGVDAILTATTLLKMKCIHAKEMEKEQIIDAFGVGCHVESTRLIGYHGMAEQYYNETFNTNEE